MLYFSVFGADVQGNLHVYPFVISLTLDGFLAPDDPVRGLDVLQALTH